MSIAPIIKTVTVKAPPAKAFEIFTSKMGEWWKVGTTMSGKPHVAITIEPKVGGRWFERDAAVQKPNGAKCWHGTLRSACCWRGKSVQK